MILDWNQTECKSLPLLIALSDKNPIHGIKYAFLKFYRENEILSNMSIEMSAGFMKICNFDSILPMVDRIF